ncbi:MAG: HK97 gp10 family phage protein [bacterium]
MQISCNIDGKAFLKAMGKIPDRMQQELRDVLKTAAQIIQAEATENHNYKDKSGQLTKSIQFTVNPYDWTAQVYLDEGIAHYGPYQHEGTGRYGPRRREYLIKPRRKELLRWSSKGKFYSAKQVIHPGVKPDPFLYLAAQKKEKEVKAAVEKSINKVLKEAELL